ncbi:hypothetical protein BHE74_00020343 [Ensete ventricosum]|uniref:Uncharacterized protein n=1 Tax=Ensete ventricosum TaxID=4639 RepID=A0A426ZGP5_ENSVE|nr:hypothetical protein B296_00021710 [Ensete ventricosum]RWW19530.1 hypothetical protein GW17_00016398 [Ensete ventricosum]RWW71883.1 hypothetical protein BHE74_00020343 [Ensete ventricosum]RZR99317.1 hypothetical protein BHM03_00028833 [Ensete ventricosum]
MRSPTDCRGHNHAGACEAANEGGRRRDCTGHAMGAGEVVNESEVVEGTTAQVMQWVLLKSSIGLGHRGATTGHAWVLVKLSIGVRSLTGRGACNSVLGKCRWA